MPFSSTDSLPMSYHSRASSYATTTSHTLSADTDGLHRLLATRDITTQVIAGAFEEFAWRGLLRGTRVRDWCEGLRTLLDELHIVQDLHTALQNPSIVTLFPFLSLITTPAEVQAHFFYPPPTLPDYQLAGLDRETLVDALLSLLEGSDFICEDDLLAPVTELVLEHIGTIWRRQIMEDVSPTAMADGTAKALVELEFELQCEGNKSNLRTLIFPIVRRIRFDLGFVTSLQLVSRLKSFADPGKTPANPHHLITAWAIRRLNAGMSPQKVYDGLIFIRERVRERRIEEVFDEVCSRLGLEQKDSQEEDNVSQYTFATIPPTPSPSTKKGFSLFSSKKTLSRKSLGMPQPNHLYPTGFDPARRPSLPAVFHSTQSTLFNPTLKSTSLTSFQSTGSNDSIPSLTTSHTPSLASDLLSQIMTFSDSADVRLILLDYVVEVRYRLHVGGGYDWYFGSGRETAASTLDTLEGRLVGKRDVMDLAAVFAEIRTKFDIPPPGSPIRLRATRGRANRLHANRSESSLAHVQRDLPQDVAEPSLRGVSFEIDSYYHRHIEEEDEDEGDARTMESGSTDTVKDRRKSTGAASQFSLSSCLSTNVQPGLDAEADPRMSMLTYTFSIREAKVGHAEEARRVDNTPKSGSPEGSEGSHLTYASIREAKHGRAEEVHRLDSPRKYTIAESEGSLYSHSSHSHGGLSSPLRTFFPSRSESSLADAYAALPSPSSHLTHGHPHRLSPIPASSSSGHSHGHHLGVPRSVRSTTSRASSPVGSFHSLLSALDLETRVPIDFDHLDLVNPTFLNASPLVILPRHPTSPAGRAAGDRASRMKQNRSYVVVDMSEGDLDITSSPISPTTPSFPLGTNTGFEYPDVPTPTLEPTRRRRRGISDRSVSTLDSIPEVVPRRTAADLPLARLLALFTAGNGLAGAKEGMRAEDVKAAVEAFVGGEMRYADEMGSGWDGEDQRRVVWLLRQIAAMIPDPALQYPIHQHILYLARNPPPSQSNRPSLASTTSTSSGSTSTNRFPATPATRPRPFTFEAAPPPTPAMSTPTHAGGFSLGVTLATTPVVESRPRSAAAGSGMGKGMGMRKGNRSSMMDTFGVGLGEMEGEVKGYEMGHGEGLGTRLSYV